MIQVEVEKNLICMEDIAVGTGSVQQSRGGSLLTLTKVSAEVFPYSNTQTVAEKINDLDAKYDYVIANTSTSFAISTLIRKSGEDLIDVNGDVFTPQVVATSSAAEALYPAKLWVKVISATEHHLKRGADLIAKFNPTTHAQIFSFDYNAIAASVLSLLGLGTAAYIDVGTSANKVVQLDADSKLPAVDGSQLTNLPIPTVTSIPIGGICMWPLAVAPAGFIIADGSTISRTTYAALFAVYGTTYGSGDGSTTFGIPDFRGVVPRGLDAGRGLDSGRALGDYQADSFAAHRHHSVVNTNGSSTSGSANNSWTRNSNYASGNADYTGFFSASEPAIGRTSNVGSTETRGKNISTNFIIRYV